MGVRGELFSNRVLLPNRTYFFNVKENRMGDIYLNIVESKNRETGGFDRQSVVLFADDLQEFLKGFDESLRVMEKAVREKRRGGGNRDSKGRDKVNDGERRFKETRFPSDGDSKRGERPGRRDSSRQNRPGERPAANRRPDRDFDRRPDRSSDRRSDRGSDRRPDHGSDRGPGKGRRVVVKKHER